MKKHLLLPVLLLLMGGTSWGQSGRFVDTNTGPTAVMKMVWMTFPNDPMAIFKMPSDTIDLTGTKAHYLRLGDKVYKIHQSLEEVHHTVEHDMTIYPFAPTGLMKYYELGNEEDQFMDDSAYAKILSHATPRSPAYYYYPDNVLEDLFQRWDTVNFNGGKRLLVPHGTKISYQSDTVKYTRSEGWFTDLWGDHHRINGWRNEKRSPGQIPWYDTTFVPVFHDFRVFIKFSDTCDCNPDWKTILSPHYDLFKPGHFIGWPPGVPTRKCALITARYKLPAKNNKH